jgi:hypothetical protein
VVEDPWFHRSLYLSLHKRTSPLLTECVSRYDLLQESSSAAPTSSTSIVWRLDLDDRTPAIRRQEPFARTKHPRGEYLTYLLAVETRRRANIGVAVAVTSNVPSCDSEFTATAVKCARPSQCRTPLTEKMTYDRNLVSVRFSYTEQ